MTSLLKPAASMVSTESTVTEFLMPDTVRLVQWPVITTVLDMPLTLTMLSLQAIVRFTLTPETLRLAPAGGRVVAGCAVGVGTARETDGVGERTTKLPWESGGPASRAGPVVLRAIAVSRRCGIGGLVRQTRVVPWIQPRRDRGAAAAS